MPRAIVDKCEMLDCVWLISAITYKNSVIVCMHATFMKLESRILYTQRGIINWSLYENQVQLYTWSDRFHTTIFIYSYRHGIVIFFFKILWKLSYEIFSNRQIHFVNLLLDDSEYGELFHLRILSERDSALGRVHFVVAGETVKFMVCCETLYLSALIA